MRRSSMSGSSAALPSYIGTNSSLENLAVGLSPTAASGQNSIALGKECVANNTYCVAIGAYNTAGGSSVAAVALGENCTATGTNSMAIGFQCTASATYSKAIGHYCNATATNSIALGNNATANRGGQLTWNSGASALAQNFCAIGLTGTGAAASVNLAGVGAAELAVGASEVWSVLVMVTGFKSDKTASATTTRIVHIRAGASSATKVGETSLHDDMATPGWSVTTSCPSGLTFRIACDPGADTVYFDATVIWLSRYVS